MSRQKQPEPSPSCIPYYDCQRIVEQSYGRRRWILAAGGIWLFIIVISIPFVLEHQGTVLDKVGWGVLINGIALIALMFVGFLIEAFQYSETERQAVDNLLWHFSAERYNANTIDSILIAASTSGTVMQVRTLLPLFLLTALLSARSLIPEGFHGIVVMLVVFALFALLFTLSHANADLVMRRAIAEHTRRAAPPQRYLSPGGSG